MCIHVYVQLRSKISLTDHPQKSITSIYHLLYLGPRRSPITIFRLPKPTISLKGPLNVGPVVGRFREGFLCIYIYIYIHIYICTNMHSTINLADMHKRVHNYTYIPINTWGNDIITVMWHIFHMAFTIISQCCHKDLTPWQHCELALMCSYQSYRQIAHE